ncbi:tRNA lysidine(34) synthetase TilS [Microaerobacter geothermalis]|uniref:tRNA lysidine(34) synthetase TilS n=1 Tax=Microaerobacter geothermalis TaxID=674972 RepID=UPI001F4908DD|nr:tRNA lysidine(34) synthetase TilS [Microaerobacter geothermalis]MCF6094686.1 tRNA lysidine(34) synthetase TilS [Microaerobacter geothermalis]
MLEIIFKKLITEKMIQEGETIVVGVSGGPDSVALLHLLFQLSKRYPMGLVAAHLNHSFRGEEADEDACYVKQLSDQLHLPSVIKKMDVPLFMEKTGLGPQEAARKLRYQFFLETARAWNAKKIALGHHADDQVETILMRLIRGTGSGGIQGIPERRSLGDDVEVIRPLLSVWKNDLEAYCEIHQLHPRLDKSNLKSKYTRNKIRLEVIPLLESINPKVKENILHFQQQIKDDHAYIEKESKKILLSVSQHGGTNQNTGNRWVIKRSLKNYPVTLQRRVIKLILNYLFRGKTEISYVHIESVQHFIKENQSSGEIHLPMGLTVKREYDKVIFFYDNGISARSETFQEELRIPGKTYIPQINCTFNCYLHGENLGIIASSPNRAVFDYEQLIGNRLWVRSRLPGDLMNPLGMKGRKKLKNIFIDEKIPKEQREKIPVVVDEKGQILWVAGVKRSNMALVSPTTKKILVIEMENG